MWTTPGGQSDSEQLMMASLAGFRGSQGQMLQLLIPLVLADSWTVKLGVESNLGRLRMRPGMEVVSASAPSSLDRIVTGLEEKRKSKQCIPIGLCGMTLKRAPNQQKEGKRGHECIDGRGRLCNGSRRLTGGHGTLYRESGADLEG